MDDKLTRKSQEALSRRGPARRGGRQPAGRARCTCSLALLEQADGTTGSAAAGGRRRPGADRQAGRRAARPAAAGRAAPPPSAPEMSRPLLAVINTAASRARQLGDEYISTEHLLVGLATDGGDAQAAAAARRAPPRMR